MSTTYQQLEPVIMALDDRIKTNLGAFPTDTAEGSNASFADGADGLPLKSLIVNIDPVQDTSSGDPSPENICPISGWTGANVTRCGKNLLNPDFSAYQIGNGYSYMNGVVPEGQTARFTFIDKDTSVNLSGTSIGFQNGLDLNHSLPTVYNWVMQNGEINSNVTNVKSGVTCSGVFIYLKTEAAFDAIFSRWDIMVELGSEATPYEPYSGQTIPVDWQTEAGTVYGGKLDVLSGVLTVTHSYDEIPATDWSLSGTNFWRNMSVMSNTNPAQVGWCTHYKNEVTTIGNNTIIFGYSGFSVTTKIVIRDSRFTTASDFMAFLAEQDTNGTPVMIAYPLKTPIEIQLTPHGVNSLFGTNNIFADTGDCSVEYRADTKLYIERLTEPDADMIADANIVSGQYFMVGNKLYKATANIASGSAVIVGTNAIRKSLSEALNEINV